MPHAGQRIPTESSSPNRSRSSARSIASLRVPTRKPPAPRAGELERRLAAELDHDALGGSHTATPRRRALEVETVGGVVGRDRLRVAVDHDASEALHRMHAAVVELDPLADAGFGPEPMITARGLPSAASRPPRRRSSSSSSTRRRPRRRTSRRAGTRAAHSAGFRSAAARARAGTTGESPRQVVEVRPRRHRARIEFARAHRLPKRLAERAADAHRFADGLHLRARGARISRRRSAELDDDVVQSRLEARRRRLSSGRSGSRRACSRRRASRRPSRSGSSVAFDASATTATRAGSSRSRAAHRFPARARTGCSSRRSRRRPRGSPPRRARSSWYASSESVICGATVTESPVCTHRVEVLDRADDHDVVVPVAHHLRLSHRFLDEHLADRTFLEAALFTCRSSSWLKPPPWPPSVAGR